MKRALEAMVIEGIKTTIPLHQKIMDDPKFRAGDISTSFMEYFLARKGRKAPMRGWRRAGRGRGLNGVSAVAVCGVFPIIFDFSMANLPV